MEVRKEVVHRLSEDSGPVDGVYRPQVVFLVEFPVSEESFDDVLRLGVSEAMEVDLCFKTHLTIVERSLDSDVVNVWIGDRSHLGLLDGRDTAFRMKNENGNVLLVSKAINCSAVCR